MICPNCFKEVKENGMLCPYCGESIEEEVLSNWQSEIEQVVIGYEEHRGLVHGLQKDAIQNGWGHRRNKKGKDWSFEFCLLKGPDNKYLLTMTDINGFGLTGRNLLVREIGDNLPEDERLAKFEHMYFPSDSEQAGGLYGRGKLLFTAASKDRCIIYDSLTHDGVYRLNRRQLKGRSLRNYPKALEAKDAKRMLRELTKGALKPLEVSGTRITIVNLEDGVLEAMGNGSFIKYIEETWWQILVKFKGRILIKTEDGTQIAEVPKEFRNVPTGITKEWKSREYSLFFDYGGDSLKIKKVRFIVSPGRVPSKTKGVYLYRREMKVADLELKNIPEEIKERLYGYVEIETNSELESIYLKEKVEGPEHYSINVKKGLGRKLRSEVQLAFERFKQELGYIAASQRVAEEKTRRAMARALEELNKRMGQLGISIGKTPRKKGISVRLKSIKLPHEANLVNSGDRISNIRFEIRNRSEDEYRISIKAFVKELGRSVIDTLYDGKVLLKGESKRSIGPFSITISPEKYPSEGEIYCSCVVKNTRTNEHLAEKTVPIYVGKKPPLGTEPIGLVLNSVFFPRGPSNRRVNYGESVSSISYIVTNNTAQKIRAKYKARVLNAIVTSEEVDELHEEDIYLEPFEDKEVLCPDLEVTKEKYNILDRERGPIILRSTIIALEPLGQAFGRGDKLAKNDLKFWVNMDSGRGVFEDFRSWPGGPTEPRSRVEPEGGGFAYVLNKTHPAYESLLENGDDSAQESYNYEQMIKQTLILVLKKDMLERWPEIRGKDYKEAIESGDSANYEQVEACLNTLDYLYAQYLR